MTEMKISWLLLTYNRAATVEKALQHCAANAGMKWHEIVWVDNGSDPNSSEESQRIAANLWEISYFCKTSRISCHYPHNLGVARGYNTCMALATGTHMVITGCDFLLPDNWMKNMATLLEDPSIGIVTIYGEPIEKTPERIRGPETTVHGFRVRECMPIGRRMLSKSLQREIGYFHEGFGKYAWDDLAFAGVAERVCREKGLKIYNLLDHIGEHLGTEGNVGYDFKDEHEYWAWKKKEVAEPYKQVLLKELEKQGWPKFNPF